MLRIRKPWNRLFDFFFQLSLLLPNRVAVGITAVLGSLIDKWEKGSFLDEMVEDLVKPFIKPFWTEFRTGISFRTRGIIIGTKTYKNRVDGVPVRVPGPQDEKFLEPAVHLLHMRAGSRSRSGQQRPVFLEFSVIRLFFKFLRVVPKPKKYWQGLLPEHVPEDVPNRQAALLREPINLSFGNNTYQTYWGKKPVGTFLLKNYR